MKLDMSPHAITKRLEAVSQLARACVELGKIGKANGLQRPLTDREREIVERNAQRRHREPERR